VIQHQLRFEGPLEDDELARHLRLGCALKAVRDLMLDHERRTLKQISTVLNGMGIVCPEASVSAHLRHLRKPKHGNYVIEKEHVGNGLYAYWLVSGPHVGPLPLE